METDVAVLERASAVLESAVFGSLVRSTAQEYRRIADRIQSARVAAGDAWTGIDGMPGAKSTAANARAAWARRSHMEVASAVSELQAKVVPVADALARLRSWLPEAESCRPCPAHAPVGGGDHGKVHRGSKRMGLRDLPPDWISQLWAAAEDHRHKDAIAILIVTGCRPAEACYGTAVRVVDGDVEVALVGAKVTCEHGQPWRLLRVAVEPGPAEHLADLVTAAGGTVRINPACRPAALSMAIAELGAAIHLPRRSSAYDIRHQRASDARCAFGGDMNLLAAWLGHSATSTARHYGRLPRAAGSRGPMPLDARAPREVRHRTRTPHPQAQPSP